MPKVSENQLGFTLIELMISITIIAVLSILALTIYSGLQRSGRDSRRKEEIIALAVAIESKRDTVSGNYTITSADLLSEFPSNANASLGLDPSGLNYCVYGWSSVQMVTPQLPSTLANTKSAPCTGPPVSGTNPLPIAWAVGQSGKEWILCASLENNTVPFCKTSLAGF